MNALNVLKKLLKEENFKTSYEKFVFCNGYIKGIAAQKGNDWCNLTEDDINVLIRETTK